MRFSYACIVTTVCETLTGCMYWETYTTAFDYLVTKPLAERAHVREQAEVNAKIGYQSIPTQSPRIGNLRIVVFPLNTNIRTGRQPFIVCIAPRWTSDPATEALQSVSVRPEQVFLRLSDGKFMRPTGYALGPVCPYPEYQIPVEAVTFHEIRLDEVLVSRLNPHIGWGLPDLALRFDVATPAPEQMFSLQLGSVGLNDKWHVLPEIEFSPHYGQINRF